MWMWDFSSLRSELSDVGFSQVTTSLGDFCDALFLEVEDEGRWKDCLGIECRA